VDEEPDTLRTCEACGGDGQECAWCASGFQTVNQRVSWRKFRLKMRNLSGTYNLLEEMVLEEMVKDIIKGLEKIHTEEASIMIKNGKMMLKWWKESDPDTIERDESARKLSEFCKDSIEVLRNFKSS